MTELSEKIHRQDRFTTAVLLVNLGSPDKPETPAIRRYLKQFLQDPRVIEVPRIIWFFILRCIILPLRSSKVAKLYASVWTQQGAPLVADTKALSQELAKQYGTKGIEINWAMRYGAPSIRSRLQHWQQQGLERLIVLPLYPQYAASTSASVFDQLASDMQFMRWLPHIHFISSYHDHRQYIQAIAQSIHSNSNDSHYLILSFHGLPVSMLEKGDPYYCMCHTSARLIAEELNLADDQWQLSFQSRFGKQPWLQPYTDKVLQQLPKQGTTQVRIACPGFAIDCLETLEEIAIQNRDIFIEAGGQELHYIPCLNSSQEQQHLMQTLIDPVLDMWQHSDQQRQHSSGTERKKRYTARLSNQQLQHSSANVGD